MKVERGSLTCNAEDAETVAEALTLARAMGVKFVYGRAVKSACGKKLTIPLVTENRCSASSTLSNLLDTCDISWQGESKVGCSQSWTLHAAKKLRDPELKETPVVASDFMPQGNPASSDCADPFDELIGLEEPKRLVRELANTIAAFGRDCLASTNIAFKGNPGTGKSEVARAFSSACAQLGVTSGRFVSLSASQLVSNHVGETPMFVRREFKKANNGILFLDEAYALTTDVHANEFGLEAVNELVYLLEMRKDVIVIAAGYADEMDHFLGSNPGLRSRFAFELDFPDYSDSQLVEIFEAIARKRRFEVRAGAGDELFGCMGALRSEKGFANGRTMRNLLDRAVMRAAFNHPSERFLNAQDVAEAMERLRRPVTKVTTIGFI